MEKLDIKIEDLRIGNYYVGYDDKIHEVDLELFRLISNHVELDEIIKSPVPFTEEILIKLGLVFEYACWSWRYLSPRMGEWSSYTELSLVNGALTYLKSYPSITGVHELQNLYFALNSKELKFIKK